MDPLRDDAIIYERALRVEGGIQTKMDIYPGLPHCFWEIFPQLPASQKFICDRMVRFRWLLEAE
jgi:acetyl esterase/lipase